MPMDALENQWESLLAMLPKDFDLETALRQSGAPSCPPLRVTAREGVGRLPGLSIQERCFRRQRADRLRLGRNLTGRVKAILNYVATADRVVAFSQRLCRSWTCRTWGVPGTRGLPFPRVCRPSGRSACERRARRCASGGQLGLYRSIHCRSAGHEGASGNKGIGPLSVGCGARFVAPALWLAIAESCSILVTPLLAAICPSGRKTAGFILYLGGI